MSNEENNNIVPGDSKPENPRLMALRRSSRTSRGPADAFTRTHYALGKQAADSRARRVLDKHAGVTKRRPRSSRTSRSLPTTDTGAEAVVGDSPPLQDSLLSQDSPLSQDAELPGQGQEQQAESPEQNESPEHDEMEQLRQIQALQQVQGWLLDKLLEQIRRNEDQQGQLMEQMRRNEDQQDQLMERLRRCEDQQGQLIEGGICHQPPAMQKQQIIMLQQLLIQAPLAGGQLQGLFDGYSDELLEQAASEFIQQGFDGSEVQQLVQQAMGQIDQPALVDYSLTQEVAGQIDQPVLVTDPMVDDLMVSGGGPMMSGYNPMVSGWDEEDYQLPEQTDVMLSMTDLHL